MHILNHIAPCYGYTLACLDDKFSKPKNTQEKIKFTLIV